MKIGIVGLGLIGGSLGIDLTKQGYEVVGVSRRQETCDIAVKNKVVSQASTGFQILADTQLIFVCTPIAHILDTIAKITPHISSETIITDVASVKESIVEPATKLWTNFVGSHPMAGTANQGILAAIPELFKNAPCVITTVDETNSEAVKSVTQIWQKLGCNIYNATPLNHDRAVAWISHLPVMISANLIDSCVNFQDPEVVNLAKQLASSGFRDTSRVGGGNVELGLMMAQYNRQQVLACLKAYQTNLDSIISTIENEQWQDLETLLTKTQQQRPDFVE